MIAGFRLFSILLLAVLSQSAQAQQAYPSADAAAEALVVALGSEKGDVERLAALLGADWQSYIPTGDVEREDVDAFLGLYREKHMIEPAAAGRQYALDLPFAIGARQGRLDLRCQGWR